MCGINSVYSKSIIIIIIILIIINAVVKIFICENCLKGIYA